MRANTEYLTITLYTFNTGLFSSHINSLFSGCRMSVAHTLLSRPPENTTENVSFAYVQEIINIETNNRLTFIMYAVIYETFYRGQSDPHKIYKYIKQNCVGKLTCNVHTPSSCTLNVATHLC